MYREDINIDGKLQRKQKQVRLGTLAEIPTKNAARNKLSEFLNTTPVMGMFFRDLVKRWQDAEGPVLTRIIHICRLVTVADQYLFAVLYELDVSAELGL